MSGIKMHYEDIGAGNRDHVIYFELDHETIWASAQTVADKIQAFADENDIEVGRLDMAERDYAASYGLMQYAPWLRENVGQRNDDWLLYAIENELGIWIRIRFDRREDAMLFKLTFDNQ